MARECKSVRCYNCERAGHRAGECERPVLCGVCLASSHPLAHCPYLVYSANVESTAPSYAEVINSQERSSNEQDGSQQRDEMEVQRQGNVAREGERGKTRAGEERTRGTQTRKERT